MSCPGYPENPSPGVLARWKWAHAWRDARIFASREPAPSPDADEWPLLTQAVALLAACPDPDNRHRA